MKNEIDSNIDMNMGLVDKNEEYQEGEEGSESSQTVSFCLNGRERASTTAVNLICSNSIGRTGTMFGFQHFDGVMPDMFTFAKGVTSAYLPLSGVGMRDHVFDWLRENPMGYGSTYFAHPVCCAAGYETVKHILEHDIVGIQAT